MSASNTAMQISLSRSFKRVLSLGYHKREHAIKYLITLVETEIGYLIFLVCRERS